VNRRTYLAVAAGVGLAGCGGSGSGSASPTATGTDGSTETPTAAPVGSGALSVAGFETPATVQARTPYPVTVRVENPTDSPGRFESALSVRLGGEWRTFAETLSGEVAAGETRAFETRLPGFGYLGTYDLRLDATGGTATVEVVARELSFGEQFSTPRDLAVSVEGGQFTSSFTGGGNATARTPPADSQWVVVRVTVVNPTGEPVQFPPYGAFVLVADGERYPVALSDPDAPVEISGDQATVELPYVVPTSAAGGSLRVRWQPTYGGRRTGAVWS
jgi:hypothetical protein